MASCAYLVCRFYLLTSGSLRTYLETARGRTFLPRASVVWTFFHSSLRSPNCFPIQRLHEKPGYSNVLFGLSEKNILKIRAIKFRTCAIKFRTRAIKFRTRATELSTETPATELSTETPATELSTETPATELSTETRAITFRDAIRDTHKIRRSRDHSRDEKSSSWPSALGLSTAHAVIEKTVLAEPRLGSPAASASSGFIDNCQEAST